ncbi:hypothetical protein TcCL_NonESM11701 [Trypanosoma cruzi]|nr:hypothetical protein TcCL_NonESM11701 [Trypanosoma cruzi]
MPAVSVLTHHVLVAALRRRHSSPLQDERDVFLSLASNGRSSCYVVRVFLQDNEFANGYEGCVTAGVECRFGFFLTDGVEELQALADVVAGVRACVSAARSAAVGKTSFTLAVEAGINEANVRAHHPTFCTVLPRRLDPIASHVWHRHVAETLPRRGREAAGHGVCIHLWKCHGGRNADLSASGISLPFDAIFGESVVTVWCSCLLLDDWNC